MNAENKKDKDSGVRKTFSVKMPHAVKVTNFARMTNRTMDGILEELIDFGMPILERAEEKRRADMNRIQTSSVKEVA